MDKKFILEKLEMLVNLCEKTEVDNPGSTYLFNEHLIRSQEMIKEIRDLHYGRTNLNPDSERDLLINIMKQSNKIWRIRNRIKNGGWDDSSYIEMSEQIEDYIAQNQKINAIKYYRQEMDEKFGEQVGLREAKEFIDGIASDMKRRGI